MIDLGLLVFLAILVAGLLFGFYRSVLSSVPRQPMDERAKAVVTLILGSDGLYHFARYASDQSDQISLLLGVTFLVAAVFFYITESPAQLSEQQLRMRDRWNSLIILGLIALILFMTVEPERADQVVRYGAVGAAAFLATRLLWYLLRGLARR